LKKVLTDYEALQYDSLATVLSSISQTYIQRIAENFTQTLFGPEGALGGLARAYAEGPEIRMKQNLEEALAFAGEDIATKFYNAGAEVATMLAMAMNTTLPGEETNYAPTGYTGRTTISKGTEIDLSSAVDLDVWNSMTEEQRKQARLLQAQNKATKELVGHFVSLSAAMAGAAIGGGGPNAQIGSQFGGMVGRAAGDQIGQRFGEALGGAVGTFAGPVGTVVGSVLLLGGMFDDNREKDNNATLKRIDTNTRESADILELNRQLLEVSRGAFNVPSTFTLPQYTPFAGGTSVSQQNVITANITVQGANGPEVIEAIREQFGPMLQQELGKIGY